MVINEVLRAAEHIRAEIERGPVTPVVSADDVRRHLVAQYDFLRPLDLTAVASDVQRLLGCGQVQVTHPRYFGLFNPSVTPASVVADMLTAAYNPQLASWRTSPAANEIERHTLRWLAEKFGQPPDSVATFTTGGAEANLTAAIVALTRHFPQYGDGGLRSVPQPPVVYVSREAHHSFHKIAHMTGLGRDALRSVAVDAQFRMDLNDLRHQIVRDRQDGRRPFMVVGTAGTTGAGAIDPLAQLAELCRAEGLWFHVDGAWGGAAILSPRLRSALAGIERADSITCDAHKWFSVPMGAGMFFCRDADAVDVAFRADTSYMPRRAAEAMRDPYTSSVQWSRRFIGLKLFLALAERGEAGYLEMIEHQTQMGDVLRTALREDGWTIVNATPLPVVCFTRERLDSAAFLAALYARQIAWMSDVRLGDGAPVLRASVTSYRTTAADITFVVEEMRKLVLAS